MTNAEALDRARLVLPGTAPEADWLAARRAGITASEIAVVMGLSSWSSPYKLYWQKTGDLPDDDRTDRQTLGQVLEPYVAVRFSERYPEFGQAGDGRSLYARPERPWQMATPDRLLFDGIVCCCIPDPVAVLECKSWGTYDGWGEEGSDEIPVHIRCQVLWQMDVMGVDTAYVACVFLPSAQLRVYELTFDDQAVRDLSLMRTEAVSFLSRIERHEPPDVDWRPATTETLKHLHADVEDIDVPVGRMPIIQYRAACKARKAAEQRKKLAENRLRQLLGGGHRIVSAHTGEVIARRDVYGVKEHTRRASHVDKLVPVQKPTKEATTP